MSKPDYNIEFAHIYADDSFKEEQAKSIIILKEAISQVKEQNKSFVISNLLDDSHPPVFKLENDKIIKKYQEKGVDIDFIGFESKLGAIADKLIKEIPNSELKYEYFHDPDKQVLMLNEEGKKIGLEDEYEFMYRHTCALLSAAWTLSRLGVYDIPSKAIYRASNSEFKAKKAITILPKKYKSVEDKVLEILRSTKFEEVIDRMEYKYFEI